MGIDRTYYCRIETGRCKPYAKMAKEIVAFYGPPLTRDQVLFPEEYVGSPLDPQLEAAGEPEAA